MSKEFNFNIDSTQCEWVFKPVRSKIDVIEILMRTIKTILIYDEPDNEQVKGQIKLHISKMSRVFFFSERKYYSLSFPFSVEKNIDDSFLFSNQYINEIDNYITSKVLSIIKDEKFSSSCFWTFLELFDENLENDIWLFFKSLLMYEDGYIRYDVDSIRQNERIHPLYHFDIFYSNQPTFKIGFDEHCSNDAMVDILNVETDCYFFRSS